MGTSTSTPLLLILNQKLRKSKEPTLGRLQQSFTDVKVLLQLDRVTSCPIKFLGVMIDDRLNFTSYVDYVDKKAAMATAALTRTMSNSSAIHSCKRRILTSVTTSILRYGEEAWRP
ncbi:uncharacterized protein LOC129754017 [Uranotaenia lowii]|uniref:uncharacterized protein LOC129754017 n=1 Tax=Uranotaenia lowii TaxID=190385 RepID=UPI00247A39AD|nr:uncharacterized protein LOC129754017 [Uranotaenia lowii]